jgi:carbonic anhydrase
VRYVLALGFLAVVTLAACGDDDDPDEPAGPTVSATSDETTADVHWSYEGDTGPANWASLSDEFAACAEGVEQSPVAIETTELEPEDIPDPQLNWPVADVELVNNGHTVQANLPDGMTSDLNGRTYQLLQFHWHRPSEHSVDGRQFDLEMHFVHSDTSGELAVLGVLLEGGDGAPVLDALLAEPPAEGVAVVVPEVNLRELLPEDLSTYLYAGSLTTPPCSEGVAWHLLTTPGSVSEEQVETFPFENNARPVQPLHGRAVSADED